MSPWMVGTGLAIMAVGLVLGARGKKRGNPAPPLVRTCLLGGTAVLMLGILRPFAMEEGTERSPATVHSPRAYEAKLSSQGEPKMRAVFREEARRLAAAEEKWLHQLLEQKKPYASNPSAADPQRLAQLQSIREQEEQDFLEIASYEPTKLAELIKRNDPHSPARKK